MKKIISGWLCPMLLVLLVHLALLLVPMRRMGTHPGCGASSLDSKQLPSIAWDGMRRISHCIPMRCMGTRNQESDKWIDDMETAINLLAVLHIF